MAARTRLKREEAKRTAAIAQQVRGLVEGAGMTHAQLAERTGWDEQRVYRVLHGRTRLTAFDMELLARILEKPVSALYRESKAAS